MAEAAHPSVLRWPLAGVDAGMVVLALVPLGFLVLLLLAPALRLLAEAAWSETGWLAWFDPWADDYLRWRLLWSGLQAALTCALVLALGVPVAWVLARLEFPGRDLLLRALMLPFVVPTLVAAMGVLALLGPRGVLQSLLPFPLEQTPWLLLYGNVFFNLCILVRAATEALEQVSASRVAAARTLGATPWRAFWRIEWPAILPWLMSALCLVFLYCFSGFGLALLLGGPRYATVEVEIYTLVAHELQLTQAGVLELAVQAARAKATVGEISDALEAAFGRHVATVQTVSGVYAKEAGTDARFARAREMVATFVENDGGPPRILIAKLGQDGHDRGQKVVATGYGDLGFDVTAGALFQTPAEAARDAVDKGVHAVGASSLAAGHLTLVPELKAELERLGRPDIMIVVGGVIPPSDVQPLLDMGAAAVYPPGSAIADTAADLIEKLNQRLGYAQPAPKETA